MVYVAYGLVSLLIGFMLVFSITSLVLANRKSNKKDYNLPLADEYTPETSATYRELNSIDGQNAKKDFKVK